MSSQALVEGAGNFGPLLALVLDSLSSEHSRRAYTHALGEFFRWYEAAGGGGFTKAAVQRYRSDLEGQLAGSLAAGPSFALEITKDSLNREATQDLAGALEAEAQIQAACMLGPNFREAYEAFTAKRDAKFV